MIIKYFEEKNVARYCFELEIVCDEFVLYLSYLIVNTVEPVYNGHPRDLRNWPLNAGGRLIQDH